MCAHAACRAWQQSWAGSTGHICRLSTANGGMPVACSALASWPYAHPRLIVKTVYCKWCAMCPCRSYSDAPTNAPTSTANQHAAAQTGQASTSDPQAAAAAKPNDSTWAAPQSATNQPSMQRQHAQPASTSTSVSTTQLQQQTDELTIMRQKIDDLMKVRLTMACHAWTHVSCVMHVCHDKQQGPYTAAVC